MFFGLDQGSAELRSSNIKGRNPFKDKRVRQAMAHAIDIEPILHDLMGELFIPAGMIVAPGVNGYAPELDQPPPYDPEKAKALAGRGRLPGRLQRDPRLRERLGRRRDRRLQGRG